MTQLAGSTPAPLPSTVTHTWIPTSDEADGTVVEILVSVKRPVTNEGRISNVTPWPPDVEMFVTNEFPTIPPLRAPFAPMAHAAPLPVALKLPLLCARQAPAPNAKINPVCLKTFMTASNLGNVVNPVPDHRTKIDHCYVGNVFFSALCSDAYTGTVSDTLPGPKAVFNSGNTWKIP